MPEHATNKMTNVGPSGAEVTAEGLIACRFASRFVDVTGQTRALANLAGMRRAKQRGRGVEFDEVRAYAAGDDVRAIDWRVTARSGTPHTKLFHEDREQPILVAVDLRAPMKFGSKRCFKSVMAAHLGAVALWSGLQAGERIGGAVLGDSQLRDTRPKRSQHAVLSMIGDLVSEGGASADGGQSTLTMADLLQHMERIARPGTRLFLISDFHDLLAADHLGPLRRLARKTQVVAISVADRLEAALPEAGFYAVTDGLNRAQLDTSFAEARETYINDFQQQQDQLSRQLRELRIPLLPILTEQDPLKQLLTVFPAR
ncbi:MAG: DUF58 domain-containing protein [Halieaceae bacterium]